MVFGKGSRSAKSWGSVNISLAEMKSIGGQWLVQMFKYIQDNPQITVNGFIEAGIPQAVDSFGCKRHFIVPLLLIKKGILFWEDVRTISPFFTIATAFLSLWHSNSSPTVAAHRRDSHESCSPSIFTACLLHYSL